MSNHHIKNTACEIGEIEGYEYWIHPGPKYRDAPRIMDHTMNGKCGYIVFKERPVTELDYNGVLTYVPVHGGITYCEHDDEIGSVYGFDTAHCDSHEFPREDNTWMKKEITLMLHGILRAAEVESKYLSAASNRTKAIQCDYIQGPGFHGHPSMGVMLSILSGEL